MAHGSDARWRFAPGGSHAIVVDRAEFADYLWRGEWRGPRDDAGLPRACEGAESGCEDTTLRRSTEMLRWDATTDRWSG